MVTSKESLIKKFAEYIDAKDNENGKLRQKVDNLKESLSKERRNYEASVRKNNELANRLKTLQNFFYAVSSEAKTKGKKI